MGKRPPYTIEDPKTGRLSYRRRYPADLRPFIPAKDGEKSAWEFRETLKDTKFTTAALARYNAAAAKYEAIEREARQRAAGRSLPLDPAVIQFLADTYLATEIEHTNRSRRAIRGIEVEDLRPYPARPDLEGDWEASVELFGDREDPPGPIDVSGIVAMWGPWCQTFARSYGYVVEPHGQAFADLCLAMAGAACRLWLAVDPHHRRGHIPAAPKQPERPAGQDVSSPPPSSTATGSSKTVSDLVDAYEAEKSSSWVDTTKIAYAPVRRLLVDAIGDRLVMPDRTMDTIFEILRTCVMRRTIRHGSLAQAILDGMLQETRVAFAAHFSLSLGSSGGGVDFDPVLFAPKVGQEAAEGAVVDEEADNLLTPVQQDAFSRLFRKRGGKAPSYLLPDGLLLFIDPEVSNALRVVGEKQRAQSDERRRFAVSPRRALAEALGKEEGAFETAFLETAQYSERVIGIDPWRKPVLPWIKPRPNSWLPERLGIAIGDPPDQRLIEVPLDQATAAVETLEAAIAAGQESANLFGDEVPATQATLDALRSIADLQSEAERTDESAHASIEPPPALREKFFLKVRENFEDVEYAAASLASCKAVAQFLAGLRERRVLLQAVDILCFDNWSLPDARFASDADQRAALKSAIAHFNLDDLRIYPRFVSRRERHLHDRSVTARLEDGTTIVWDVGGGLDFLFDGRRACVVSRWINPSDGI